MAPSLLPSLLQPATATSLLINTAGSARAGAQERWNTESLLLPVASNGSKLIAGKALAHIRQDEYAAIPDHGL